MATMTVSGTGPDVEVEAFPLLASVADTRSMLWELVRARVGSYEPITGAYACAEGIAIAIDGKVRFVVPWAAEDDGEEEGQGDAEVDPAD